MINGDFIRKHIFGLMIICGAILLPFKQTSAQFFDLQLKVDGEIEAQAKQRLAFGVFPVDAGQQRIKAGSPKMGIFSITAMEGKILIVSLDKPKVLENKAPLNNDIIPLNLISRFGYKNQALDKSQPLSNNSSVIQIASNNDIDPWNSIFIYFYGSITIGDVSEGVYSENILLDVQYI